MTAERLYAQLMFDDHANIDQDHETANNINQYHHQPTNKISQYHHDYVNCDAYNKIWFIEDASLAMPGTTGVYENMDNPLDSECTESTTASYAEIRKKKAGWLEQWGLHLTGENFTIARLQCITLYPRNFIHIIGLLLPFSFIQTDFIYSIIR